MFNKSKRKSDNTENADCIVNMVYEQLKSFGFKKFGRTLHRFVSDDISQVINFQLGLPRQNLSDYMCVNIGIRVPECADNNEKPNESNRKYYHEYECQIRSRLGEISGQQETWYELSRSPDITAQIILKEINTAVLPFFDDLSTRGGIINNRKKYPDFDKFSSTLLIDEALIYMHLGNTEKARKQFDTYYQQAVDSYNDKLTNGEKVYLKKGDSVMYFGQKITAEKDGYITVYGANDEHIKYLDMLAKKTGLK